MAEIENHACFRRVDRLLSLAHLAEKTLYNRNTCSDQVNEY